ncbi:MAG TPA: DUF2061 domain-containing protein [Ramlibacter sp.]|nr:DUF2061 domain-containing protein [Ramlibacter sp.]
MRLRHDSDLHKTLSFAVIHLAIAVTLGWLFTGGFVLGGLLALVEPGANTAVSHGLEKWAQRWRGPARRRALAKSGLLAVSHFVVAVAVGYALSGSWVAAGAYAIVEPLANAVAHYFFDRWWQRRRRAAALAWSAA